MILDIKRDRKEVFVERLICLNENFTSLYWTLRFNFSRFRISAHKLAIETGRYKGIPRHDRICTRCTDNTVEDERHFLFSCNYHTQEREALMFIINENCKNFSLLNIRAHVGGRFGGRSRLVAAQFALY